jgi:putative membrane protein
MNKLPIVLLVVVAAVLIWSGIAPHDRATWWLEVAPVLIGVPILFATHRRFPLTPLLYVLLAIHAVILIVGGKYTYAEVPLGRWVSDWLGLERNHYDRLGHFAQGFIPAILARELLLRTSPLRRGKWLFWTGTAFCLAFSAFFEMFEWWVAISSGGAPDYLGSQGDVWDAQWDMFLCLCGAVISALTLARWHDRQLARIQAPNTGASSISS